MVKISLKIFLILQILIFSPSISPASSQKENNAPQILNPNRNQAHFYVFGVWASLLFAGSISWKFYQSWTGKFQRLDEGFFGKDTYAGGSDKLGHAYTDFILIRVFNKIYLDEGFHEDDAITNSLIAGIVSRTVMEVADGFTKFKFSAEDVYANISGALLSAILLKYPKFDEIFGFSWSYLPSTEALQGERDWYSIDNDYNGSVFHLDIRLKGIYDFLGYPTDSFQKNTLFSLSYFTRGYNKIRPLKQRVIGFNIGGNIPELIFHNFEKNKFTKNIRTFATYYKIPFTYFGLNYDMDHDKFMIKGGLNFHY